MHSTLSLRFTAFLLFFLCVSTTSYSQETADTIRLEESDVVHLTSLGYFDISPDGSRLALVDASDGAATIYSLVSGHALSHFGVDMTMANSVASQPLADDGRELLESYNGVGAKLVRWDSSMLRGMPKSFGAYESVRFIDNDHVTLLGRCACAVSAKEVRQASIKAPFVEQADVLGGKRKITSLFGRHKSQVVDTYSFCFLDNGHILTSTISANGRISKPQDFYGMEFQSDGQYVGERLTVPAQILLGNIGFGGMTRPITPRHASLKGCIGFEILDSIYDLNGTATFALQHLPETNAAFRDSLIHLHQAGLTPDMGQVFPLQKIWVTSIFEGTSDHLYISIAHNLSRNPWTFEYLLQEYDAAGRFVRELVFPGTTELGRLVRVGYVPSSRRVLCIRLSDSEGWTVTSRSW